ncbi:hypothetical protein GCM10011352_31420 [Marinobacterium zhoushanense]|uniref:Solute:sodium symporter small subunit n=1 Tax=Marinobacterium zhoushanense TaxID=1679163 RepID=A0ABQ1KRF6_9GAMM|nr:hypothetical protein [Marinobacterium zhoushanense]GGC02927.1 hypothetical protein GCM10011352_31420 [Marinobacterium zhoushanense]
MAKPSKQTLLHHLGTGAGFLGLILWFFAGRELGVLDWATAVAPEGYSGAALMLSIMIMMTPAFGLWTLFNRWLERRLQIKGRYLEDEYYRSLSSDHRENKDS